MMIHRPPLSSGENVFVAGLAMGITAIFVIANRRQVTGAPPAPRLNGRWGAR